MIKFSSICFLFLLLISSLDVNAQYKKKPAKHSIGKGALFLYWGYNRAGYTRSNLNFVGSGYDFTLSGVSAKDRPSHELKTYFDPKSFTVPQFNVRAGYYFKDNWSINFGYDHMKYVMRDNNHVLLSGTINPGVDNEWSGTYTNEEVTTHADHIHYENTDGHNYIHAEIMNSIYLYRSQNKKFAIVASLGAGAGGILSFNDFNFGGVKHMKTISMSGYGINALAGIRFEFFNHLFLQAEMSGGFMHQVHVKNRPLINTAYTRHAFGYGMGQINIGGIIYIKSKNGCGTCPKW